MIPTITCVFKFLALIWHYIIASVLESFLLGISHHTFSESLFASCSIRLAYFLDQTRRLFPTTNTATRHIAYMIAALVGWATHPPIRMKIQIAKVLFKYCAILNIILIPFPRRHQKYTSCTDNHGIRPPPPEQYLTPLQQKEVCIRHLRARLKETVDRLQDRLDNNCLLFSHINGCYFIHQVWVWLAIPSG